MIFKTSLHVSVIGVPIFKEEIPSKAEDSEVEKKETVSEATPKEEKMETDQDKTDVTETGISLFHHFLIQWWN